MPKLSPTIKAAVLRVFAILLVGIGIGWITASERLAGINGSPPNFPSIDRVTELSSLLTVRIDVADVLISRIDGRTGGVSVAVLLKGDAAMGIDLSQSKFQSVDVLHRTATLVLPPPAMSYARIDHTRTRLFALSADGLWAITPGTRDYLAVVNKAMADAQSLVASSATSIEADEHARRQAEIILNEFFRTIGWQIQIGWSDRGIANTVGAAAFSTP